MKMGIQINKLINSLTSLAKISPNLALDVIVALFFSYGLHEILTAAKQGKSIFIIFGGITLLMLVIFSAIVLITHDQKKL